jgi:transposase
MDMLHRRCAGLDVHKKTVVAAMRLAVENKLVSEVRTFATTTAGLLALSDWLTENSCTHAAMEATGVYWRPVWHVLCDGELELIVANAAHVRNVPGRKTDVSDAAWLAELLAHGLIRGSFVPDAATQELRTLLRTRKQLVRERSRHVQRIHKALEDANIKLEAELSDVLGKSGRAMLDAMVAGETDPVRLAALAHPGVKSSQARLQEALHGRLTRHHRFLLQLHLGQIDGLDAAVTTLDREVDVNLAPFRTAVELVSTIPGVSKLSAEVIVSEIGLDMSRFPTVGHLLSWRACVRATIKALANAARPACAKVRPGSRPPSFNVPGPPRTRRQATCKPSSAACSADADRKRRSAPSPHPSSPPPITCSRTEPSTRISVPTTSTAAPTPPSRSAWSNACNS